MSWDASVESAHPQGGISARVDLHLGAQPGELPVVAAARASPAAPPRARPFLEFRVWAGLARSTPHLEVHSMHRTSQARSPPSQCTTIEAASVESSIVPRLTPRI